MEKWTPASPRPPRPEDAPFFAADFGVFGHSTAWVGVLPLQTTKQFDQVAKQIPELRQELERLCQTFRPEHLSALAEALQASVKGAIKRGPRRKELPAEAVAKIKGLLYLGATGVAGKVASMIPGSTKEARLKRAQREVGQWNRHKPGLQVSHQIALQWWAALEAERQLEEEIQSGTISEPEACERLQGRISEIMSFALKQIER